MKKRECMQEKRQWFGLDRFLFCSFFFFFYSLVFDVIFKPYLLKLNAVRLQLSQKIELLDWIHFHNACHTARRKKKNHDFRQTLHLFTVCK